MNEIVYLYWQLFNDPQFTGYIQLKLRAINKISLLTNEERKICKEDFVKNETFHREKTQIKGEKSHLTLQVMNKNSEMRTDEELAT